MRRNAARNKLIFTTDCSLLSAIEFVIEYV